MKAVAGLEIGQDLADFCRPDRMALLVYDMQVAIARQVPGSAAIVSGCAELLDGARSAGFPVVFLRHLSLPTRWMGAYQYRQAMTWQRKTEPSEVAPWFLRDTPGFAIVPELQPRADEAVFDKIGFSAFEGTPLATAMRDAGLTAFAICGIATEIGIDPTVRHGSDLGLVPIVVRDCCGAGNGEAGERALANMTFMGDAILADRASLLAKMRAAA